MSFIPRRYLMTSCNTLKRNSMDHFPPLLPVFYRSRDRDRFESSSLILCHPRQSTRMRLRRFSIFSLQNVTNEPVFLAVYVQTILPNSSLNSCSFSGRSMRDSFVRCGYPRGILNALSHEPTLRTFVDFFPI